MSKTLMLMLLLIAITLCANIHFATRKPKEKTDAEDQAEFNTKFSKKYERKSNDVKTYRKNVFKQNLAEIRAHNKKADRSYEKGTNFLSDFTREEYVATYLGLKPPSTSVATNSIPPVSQTDLKAGYTFNRINWTNYLTPVKDQGRCNSCWAFCTLSVVESCMRKKSGAILDLSEQQLVECSSSFGNQGCMYGYINSAFDYIRLRRINLESKYPYTAGNGIIGGCKNIPGLYRIISSSQVFGCAAVVSALANTGPLAVAVDARYWNDYKSGLFNYCATPNASSVNHGVMLVGASNTEWYIKNSFGTSWGEQGFMHLAGTINCCNICNFAYNITL